MPALNDSKNAAGTKKHEKVLGFDFEVESLADLGVESTEIAFACNRDTAAVSRAACPSGLSSNRKRFVTRVQLCMADAYSHMFKARTQCTYQGKQK